MPEAQVPAVKNKRIIVCCDGTWLNSDNGFNEKTRVLENPSNVTRFARAIKAVTENGMPQITYYQAGVGSSYDFFDVYFGGATGTGLDEHIREAYAFIVLNYVEGDEIILLGFSRGAFTARSIAGLIDTVGLLTRGGMAHFYRIFKDYENMNIEKYDNPVPGLNIPKKHLPIGKHREDYRAWLRNYINPKTGRSEPLTSAEIPKIAAIGVWDTVGSLGIPGVSFVDGLKRLMKIKVPQDELRFYNTKLASNVSNAFQALALDEMRYSFQPAVWERPAGLPTNLKQVWFPGVHSNIGGGEAEQELQDITLAWMMSQMRESCDVEFDKDYVQILFGPAAPVPSYKKWSNGLIDTSNFLWVYSIAGTHHVRTPGQYFVVDGETGVGVCDPPHSKFLKPLEDTQERIHSSVRIRLARKGPGINDKGGYIAEALTPHHRRDWNGRKRHGWTCERVKADEDIEVAAQVQKGFPREEKAQFLWRSTRTNMARGNLLAEEMHERWPKVLIEDVLGYYEKILMARDASVSSVWDKLPAQFSA